MKKLDYSTLFTLRKDGRYMGYYKDADGKRHAIYDRDPQALYEKIQKAGEKKEPTFSDIAEYWKDKKWEEYRSGTQGCYASAYNRAIEWCGEMVASEIQPSDIYNQLVSMRDSDYSRKTISTQRTIYNLVFQNAVVDKRFEKYIKYNPAAMVKLPNAIKKAQTREAPEDDIVDKIRANAQTAHFGKFALFLISTGLRRGEALAIRWRDIDLKENTISVHEQVSFRGGTHLAPTKTDNSVRTVPILPDLSAVLKSSKKGKPQEFLFPSATNAENPMPQNAYKRAWTHYCKDMGFITADGKNALTAHCMRHGYATMLFEADVDVYTAKDLLGHADVKTTMAIYTHLRQRKKNESIINLTNYVRQQLK